MSAIVGNCVFNENHQLELKNVARTQSLPHFPKAYYDSQEVKTFFYKPEDFPTDGPKPFFRGSWGEFLKSLKDEKTANQSHPASINHETSNL